MSRRFARGKARVVAFSAAFAIGLGVLACSTIQNSECDCVDPSLQLTIPPESASAVVSVTLSGNACEGVTPTCVQNGVGGCSQWRFPAQAAGNCHIDMTFASGTAYAHDVTILATTGCCAGYYADPTSAGDIAVTPPGFGADAGGESDAAGDTANADAGGDA